MKEGTPQSPENYCITTNITYNGNTENVLNTLK